MPLSTATLLPASIAASLQRAFDSSTVGLSGCVSHTETETPIYAAMVRDAYAKKARAAYAANPDMIGCGSWELIPVNGYCRTHGDHGRFSDDITLRPRGMRVRPDDTNPPWSRRK